MGPQHCCCGNDDTGNYFLTVDGASMGPQHCCCGNPPGHNDVAAGTCASMGPQHCCCGNSKRAAASRTKLASFNGAAALLLRKCGCGTGADRPSPASMGPQHCCCGNNPIIDRTQVGEKSLQWGRSIAAAEIVAACTLPARGFVASMGPQHCCCGNKRKPIS